jgi:hypothetical protein
MGYNYSIYLMAGAPYLLLAGFGLLVYRSLNKTAALEQHAADDPPQDGAGGLSPCPPPSTDEDS